MKKIAELHIGANVPDYNEYGSPTLFINYTEADKFKWSDYWKGVLQAYCDYCHRMFIINRSDSFNKYETITCPSCGMAHKHNKIMYSSDSYGILPYKIRMTLIEFKGKIELRLKYQGICFNDDIFGKYQHFDKVYEKYIFDVTNDKVSSQRLGSDGPYYTEATVGLFAGLDLDLWGVHRSAVAAAIGAHNAALAETAAVELSLTTGVAQLYYSMQASYQMLDLLEQTRNVIDYAVKAHQSKVAHGLEAQVPFHGARAQILAVDKQIAAVKGQITETRESLRALIGAGASDMPEIKPVALPRVQTGIPATLSYELL